MGQGHFRHFLSNGIKTVFPVLRSYFSPAKKPIQIPGPGVPSCHCAFLFHEADGREQASDPQEFKHCLIKQILVPDPSYIALDQVRKLQEGIFPALVSGQSPVSAPLIIPGL